MSQAVVSTTRSGQSPAEPCFLCGSRCFDGEPRFTVGKWSLVRCRSCGLGYTSPTPTADDLAAVQRETYGTPFLEERHRKARLLRKGYGAVLARMEKMVPGKGRLLDVGCGSGLFLRAACDQGWRAEGVELNPVHAAAVRRLGLTVFCGTLEEAVFPDDTFETITLWDVLEHVPAPLDSLREVYRVLKPGGLCYLQLPNLDSRVAQLAASRWGWLCLPDHRFHFTPTSLSACLAKVGFRVRNVHTWEPLLTVPRALAGRMARAPRAARLVRGAAAAAWIGLGRLAGLDRVGRGLIRAFAFKGASFAAG